MPIAPKQAMQWQCTRCSWKDSYIIKSDVIPPRPSCPKCGGDTALKPASLLAAIVEKLR